MTSYRAVYSVLVRFCFGGRADSFLIRTFTEELSIPFLTDDHCNRCRIRKDDLAPIKCRSQLWITDGYNNISDTLVFR